MNQPRRPDRFDVVLSGKAAPAPPDQGKARERLLAPLRQLADALTRSGVEAVVLTQGSNTDPSCTQTHNHDLIVGFWRDIALSVFTSGARIDGVVYVHATKPTKLATTDPEEFAVWLEAWARSEPVQAVFHKIRAGETRLENGTVVLSYGQILPPLKLRQW